MRSQIYSDQGMFANDSSLGVRHSKRYPKSSSLSNDFDVFEANETLHEGAVFHFPAIAEVTPGIHELE